MKFDEIRHDFECPFCKEGINIDEWDMYEIITYHGDNEPYETTCPYCDNDIFVKEVVNRDFYAKKTMKEAIDWWDD